MLAFLLGLSISFVVHAYGLFTYPEDYLVGLLLLYWQLGDNIHTIKQYNTKQNQQRIGSQKKKNHSKIYPLPASLTKRMIKEVIFSKFKTGLWKTERERERDGEWPF